MRAVVDERKLTEYVLNPRSKDDKHKAYVFDRVLGITAGNTEDVRQQILENVKGFKAVHAGATIHGSSVTAGQERSKWQAGARDTQSGKKQSKREQGADDSRTVGESMGW